MSGYRPRCAWASGSLAGLAIAALMAFGGVACDETDAPSVPEGPTTPKAQLEAVERALGEAEASGEWVRAEVLLEALVALEPGDSPERRVHLRRARRNREVAGALDEVAHLLDQGAWRSAEAWMLKLDALDLSTPDRARLETLRALVAEVEALEADRSLLPPTP